MTAQQAVCGDCHGVVRPPRGMSLEAVLRIHKESCPAIRRVKETK